MIRHLTKALVFILTILMAELAIEFIKHHLKLKTGVRDPYLRTLIGMGVIVGIFYPVFKFTEWFVELLTENFVEKAKEHSGNAVLGLLIAFVLGFGALFILYLKEWYGKTLW